MIETQNRTMKTMTKNSFSNKTNIDHAPLDIVGAISQLYNTKDIAEIEKRLKKISVENMINLYTLVSQLVENTPEHSIASLDPSEVDKKIMIQIHEILGDFESSSEEEGDDDGENESENRLDKIKGDIEDIIVSSNDDEDDEAKTNKILEKIKKIDSPEDFKSIWVGFDKKTKKSILLATNTESTEKAKQPAEVYKWVQKNITEHVLYRGNIVEMKVAKGPNNTVGILLKNRITMVPRRDIKMLNEHVMGMIGMPSLVRMQQLAGLSFPQVSQGHGFGAVKINDLHAKINENLEVLRADININNWDVALETLEELKSCIEQMVDCRGNYEDS